MNYPHLHLLINHLPVLGSIFSLLLVLLAMRRRSRDLTRLALWVTLVAGLSVWPAHLTGDEAHEQVENYPAFDHDTTHEHEDAADFALAWMLATAAAAGVTLYLGRGERTEPRWARGAVLLCLAFSVAVLARTAWLGGAIRHAEIRGSLFHPPVLPPLTPPAAAMPAVPMAGESDTAMAADSAGRTHVHKDGKSHTH